MIHRLGNTGQQGEKLFKEWQTDSAQASESSIAFSEVIAWERGFQILPQLGVDPSNYPDIQSYAENCLQGYAIHKNRFKDFAGSQIDVIAFMKNMTSGNYLLTKLT